MSENRADSPIVITVKGGAGFDAPWIVLRAETADEASALVNATFGPQVGTLSEQVAQAAAGFAGVSNVSGSLKGTQIPKKGSKAATKAPAASEEASTPPWSANVKEEAAEDGAEHPFQYILDEIAAATTKDALKKIYAQNKAAYETDESLKAASKARSGELTTEGK